MGILISFSGIDGAGKSTQVRLLSKYLKGKKRRIYVTEEMFGYFLLKPTIKYLRRATKSPKGGPVTRNSSILPKLWFVPAFIDIWLEYIFKIRPKLTKYDFIIADRFYTDIWANLLYYGYLPDWAFAPFIKLLPKSDVALVFKVDPRNVRKREDDFPLSYYITQTRIYDNLSSQISCHIIEANSTPKVVFSKVTKWIDIFSRRT